MNATAENTKNLAYEMALQRAMANPIGHKMFKVSPDWEISVLKNDPRTVNVSSSLDLEAALDNPDVVSILVLKESTLNEKVVSSIVERHGLTKTIFIES